MFIHYIKYLRLNNWRVARNSSVVAKAAPALHSLSSCPLELRRRGDLPHDLEPLQHIMGSSMFHASPTFMKTEPVVFQLA